MYVNFKKTFGFGRRRARNKKLVGFQLGTRETKYFEKLSQKIAHIDAEIYATDGWESYDLIDPAKHVIGKAHTFTVERDQSSFTSLYCSFCKKILLCFKIFFNDF
jgi:IS1 family transposase